MNEKYIPLYRKYRPQSLEEIVGQEHIKKSLKNAIELNKISHAYLFTGPRGTGKTSSARILAKSLNCKNGPTVKPCNSCASCIDITNSTPVDVIEIDAASNRKVEDAQNILEKVQYVPVNGKYKIYIIDEVHMLTNHAFNALLKTLEEPPENVIFILATTEPQKVLDTIKSRCQRFDFKRITTQDIVDHLKNIAKKEKININDEALVAIAKNSEGGMRDSLALLDQLSVLGSANTVTLNDINSLLGRISFDTLKELTETIISSKPNQAIEVLEKIYNSGNEPTQILLNMLEFYKNMLLVKTCNDNTVVDLTQYSDKQIEEIKPQATKLETHQIIFLIDKISNYIKEIKTSTTPHLWLEVAMIDLANLAENTSLIELQNRITKLENGNTEHHPQNITYKTAPSPAMKPVMKPASTPAPQPKPVEAQPKNEPIIENAQEPEKVVEEKEFSPMPKPEPKQENSNNISGLWQELLNNCGSLSALLQQQTRPVNISPENVIITSTSKFWVDKINNSDSKQRIINACKAMFNNADTSVLIRLASSSDKHEPLISAPQEDSAEDEEKKNIKPIEQPTISETKMEEKEPSLEKPCKTCLPKDSETEELIEETFTSELKPEKKQERMVSDQVTMVVKLFDGKYIE